MPNDRTIRARVTTHVFEALAAKAAARGLTLAAYIRSILEKEAQA